MRQFIGFTTATLIACACSVAAQTTKPAAQPGADITIIGCVEPTDPSTAAGKMADTKYMLTNAREGSASGTSSGTTSGTSGSTSGTSGTAGTSGTSTSGTTSGSRMGSTYQLDAKDATIAPEVGHVVEIVAATPEPDPSGKTPKLKVQTIKFVAATCPPK